MLDFNNFSCIDDILHYIGENEYIIAPEHPVNREFNNGYSVFVTALDPDGEPYDAGTYAASTLSAAIAIVERLEAGEAE